MSTHRLSELQDLTGKTALIVGGSGYLGSAAAQSLAELGANVIVASRSLESCERVLNTLSKLNDVQQHTAVSVDISEKESLMEFFAECSSKQLRIDILILCAWNGRKNSLSSISIEDWRYDIEICLNSNFEVVKTFENLIPNGGKILFVSSMYGVVAPSPELYDGVPQENPPSYGAAKAGIIQLTKYLAAWLGHRKINVNCISPGPFPFQHVRNEYPEFIQRLEARTIVKRVGEPEDLMGVFALLCSGSSDFITGQNICVDGGWTVC